MCPERFHEEELDAIPIGLALLDKDLRYLKVNRSYAERNGIPAEAHIGRTIYEIVPGVAPAVDGFFRTVFLTGNPVLNVEITGEISTNPNVRRTWVENISPVLGDRGEVRAALVAVVEIAAQKQAEERLREAAAREQMLMQELSHRISNGLNLVATLLDLEARSAKSDKTRSAFVSASARVRGLGIIHKHLYKPHQETLVTEVRSYLSGLCRDLGEVFLPRTAVAVHAEPGVSLAAHRMIPLGIIVAELVTNACKHSGMPTPAITVDFSGEHDRGVLKVTDEGKGLPDSFDPASSVSIGMAVVRSQVAQLKGDIEFGRGATGGASFKVSFPLN